MEKEFLSEFEQSGEMADQVRSFAWSQSALGGFHRWPQALRSCVETILASRFPMFLVWGPDRVFIYNDAYIQILGAKHPGALGKPFSILWSEVWEQIGPIIDDSFDNRASYFENMPVVLTRNGYEEQTYFTFSYSPVRGDGGAIEGALCVCAETTAGVLSKQSQASENEKLRLLFEQAPGFAAALMGPDHVFEMHNAAYGRLIGERAVLGLPVADALPETVDQGFVAKLDEVFSTKHAFIGREVRYDARRMALGGLEQKYVDFIFQPMLGPNGESRGVFVQGHEITEQVLAKKALLDADRQKDQFIATLAHELRNPLAPISAAAHLLQRPGVSPEATARAAAVIGRQIGQMSRLLDDLLDVARIARNQMPLQKERCRCDALISLAVEAARPALDAKRHRLSIEIGGDSIEVDADRVRMVQVISNLLANAAKYTDPGGSIGIASTRVDGDWELSVRDNGIGILPESIDRVFSMFAQEQSALNRAEGGLGIGLGLANGLIELHGGSVRASSDALGCGSVFTFRIPAVARGSAAFQSSAPVSQLTPPPGRSILLADDNQDLVDIVRESLEALGHIVATASDRAMGLEAYRREKPSIAVLDLGMPRINGFDLARAIRREPGGANVFLIAATGWGGHADKAEAKSAGFDAHLTKPFEMAGLLALIDQAPSIQPSARAPIPGR